MLTAQTQATQSNDKRESPRVEFKTRVLFKPGWKSNQEGMIRDVSERGAFLVSREKMFERTQVILYLPLPIRGKEILCVLYGKVVRLEEKKGVEAYGHGVRFDPPTPGTLDTIRKFVQSQLVHPTT